MTAESQSAPAALSAADLNAEIQRFVAQLAADVSGPPLELPSYPLVALRVQRILMDPHVGAERVTTIVGSEPVLAAKIILIANSAALNRSGNKVTDLRSAVSRLGFDMLRTAAIGFAIAQLRNAPAYRSIVEPMRQLCQAGVEIASISHVLARQCESTTPDSAMLAGLVSGMGKLYILTRSPQYPTLFADDWTRHEMLYSWHTQIARSILENWQFAPEVIDAIGHMDTAAVAGRNRSNLADVLACAKLVMELKSSADKLSAALNASLAARRLGLSPELCALLLEQSADQMAQLKRALGS